MTQPTRASTTRNPRIDPWSCRDADLLVQEGWQWCARNQCWFRTRGPRPFRGACGVCKGRLATEATDG